MTDHALRKKIIIHRLLQRRFERHREKLMAHKELSPMHKARVEELEARLFPDAPVG